MIDRLCVANVELSSFIQVLIDENMILFVQFDDSLP